MILDTLGYFKGVLHNYAGDGQLVIDDAIFRLHYGLTSYILLFMSLMVFGITYIGQPIECTLATTDFHKIIPKPMLNMYCYIHSTYVIPGTGTADAKKQLYPYPGVGHSKKIEDEDKIVFLTYYQWTGFILLIQAASFLLAHLFWTQLENGTLKNLRLGLHNPALDVRLIEDNISKLVLYVKQNVGQHSNYAKSYLGCIIFSLTNLCIQIYLTDLLLMGNFISYGFKYSYYQFRHTDWGIDKPRAQDMIFPKQTKCMAYIYGASGTLQNLDGFCVMPLNLFHEKIFIILWYWYIILAALSLGSLLYWLWPFFSPSYRLDFIQNVVKTELRRRRRENKIINSKNVTLYVRDYGDWFLLYMICKNIQRMNFISLVNKLCRNTLDDDDDDVEEVRQRSKASKVITLGEESEDKVLQAGDRW